MIEGFRDDVLSTLTPGELDFLYFAELHLHEMASWTLEEAARESLASGGVIERACQKLGLTGYAELRNLIRAELRGRASTVSNDLAVDYPAARAVAAATRELRLAERELDPERIRLSAEYIATAERLVIFGRGLSEFPGRYLSTCLERCGRHNRCYLDPPLVYRDASSFTSHDCIVIFSAGGRTIPVVKAAAIARRHEAVVVAACGDAQSPLARIAGVLLPTPSDRLRMGQIDLGSRLTQFLAADLLADVVAASEKEPSAG